MQIWLNWNNLLELIRVSQLQIRFYLPICPACLIRIILWNFGIFILSVHSDRMDYSHAMVTGYMSMVYVHNDRDITIHAWYMCLVALRISGETVDSARYKSIFNYYNAEQISKITPQKPKTTLFYIKCINFNL